MRPRSFETQRLIIRPTTEEDAPFVLELCNTPKWVKYIGDRNIKSVGDARDYIREKMTPQLERLGYSSFTLVRKENGTSVGVCGLYDRKGVPGIDLGFAILPDFEGEGLAYEASNRVRDAAFEVFRMDKLRAITTKDNLASQRLLEKLGFKGVGVTVLPSEKKELLVYEMSAEDRLQRQG